MESTARTMNVAVVGNYSPRQCGIATFTTDLVRSISQQSGQPPCWAVAINDRAEGYAYPGDVRFQIAQTQLSDYQLAADFLNFHQADLVCLQHEYGIFGGSAGSHILKLLDELQMPVVTTLHTVLAEPTKEYRQVMDRIAQASDRLVVMSHKAKVLLQEVHGVPEDKIVHIPHGIPDMALERSESGAEPGERILLTFGLLSVNKGIEYVLRALPTVVKRFPELRYLVVGATHPHILRTDGERYRLQLQQEVIRLKLQDNVIFHNRFVTQPELCDYLGAADLYVTPYIEKAQITSGTLAYAMGSGLPVISTPYWYAEEMLAEGRGTLVPFRDAPALSEALLALLSNDEERDAMRKRAYRFSRSSTWLNVAASYLELFKSVRKEHERVRRVFPSAFHAKDAQILRQELPVLKLDHLVAMTDDTGLLQHARYTVPNREYGYCTDDNARALMLMAHAQKAVPYYSQYHESLAQRYLGFLLHAFNAGEGRFRNFMSYDRRWLEQVGSEDAHGRALWALGVALDRSKDEKVSPLAAALFQEALPAAEDFSSPRALAFTLLGIQACQEGLLRENARALALRLAERLLQAFTSNTTPDWPWPENELAYDNARLPQALIRAGALLHREDMRETGLCALEWLALQQTERGWFTPVGNLGWLKRGGSPARYDQQPLEAHSMIDACISAFDVTGDRIWLDRTMLAFNWFLGKNDLNLPLYDAKTGGCRDGLQRDGLNQNQGAESCLAWLLSLTALQGLSVEEILFNADNQERGRPRPVAL